MKSSSIDRADAYSKNVEKLLKNIRRNYEATEALNKEVDSLREEVHRTETDVRAATGIEETKLTQRKRNH